MNILGLVFALHAVSSLKVSAVYGQRDFTDFNRNIDWVRFVVYSLHLNSLLDYQLHYADCK